MASDFLHGIMRWNVERHGTLRPLPYLYYDNLSLSAVYSASTAKVKKLIPHPDLFPIELLPGRCLVAFAAFEYRKTDHDPYNEVGISFLVKYRSKPLPLFSLLRVLSTRVFPLYVWQLPVTTEHARAGGVDLFAYPKFIADIQFSKSQERIKCSLSLPASEILCMTGKVLPTSLGKPIRYVTYTVEESMLLETNILINPLEFADSRHRDALLLEVGKHHPICEALHEMELSEHPLIYQYIPRCESILFPGRNAIEA